MKCPLYFIGRTAVIPREGAQIGDCGKEECAWWVEMEQKCAIRLLGDQVSYEFMKRDKGG